MRIMQKLKLKAIGRLFNRNGYDVEMFCFGSRGSVRSDAWKCLRNFTKDKIYIKEVLKWCFISRV